MKALWHIIKEFPAYLWTGWSSLASVLLFFGLWELGFQVYGDFILPSPSSVLHEAYRLLYSGEIVPDLIITSQRLAIGFGIAFVLGSVLGLLSGFFVTASIMARPFATIFMGTPPIAWLVLSMIWFGLGNNTVIFTIVVAAFPIIFIGALQGTRTLEGDLKEMAESFKIPLFMRFKEVYLPHIFSYIFPAWVSALGISWKIVAMAEVLSASDGLGAALGVARSQLDTQGALALVVILVVSLMFAEYIILEPIKREVEAWRDN